MGIDEAVAQAMEQLAPPLLVLAAQALAVLGSRLAWWAFVAVLLSAAWRRHWHVVVCLAVALLATDASVLVLKLLVARPRPPGALLADGDFAFPSGHAALAAAAAAVAWSWALRRAWRWGSLAFALAEAASRVVLRVHWLSDVAVGLVLGAAVGASVVACYRHDVAGALRVSERIRAGLAQRVDAASRAPAGARR